MRLLVVVIIMYSFYYYVQLLLLCTVFIVDLISPAFSCMHVLHNKAAKVVDYLVAEDSQP